MHPTTPDQLGIPTFGVATFGASDFATVDPITATGPDDKTGQYDGVDTYDQGAYDGANPLTTAIPDILS